MSRHCAISALCAGAALVALEDVASAQQYPCWNNRLPFSRLHDNQGRRVPDAGRTVIEPDIQGSTTWARLGVANDPGALQALAGTWYTEIRSPNTGAIQYLYQTYEANGLYQYRDRTCGTGYGMTTCSNNQGTGELRAVRQGDGSIFFMVRWSDLSRSSACTSYQVRFSDPGTMVYRMGGV
ncbi:MAG: hypothetical protein KGQ28_09240, partial [Hyphomicrobiales bacterium]|nr:hypothetical protein [Hyphomicrobiales bacterium]